MIDAYAREALLTVHILAVILWLGFGFFELWLGRIFLADPNSPAAAPLIRIIYNADIVVFLATLTVFGVGITQTILFGWGWFETLWLGLKQAIMILILLVVALILPRAFKLNAQIQALPEGPGSASVEVVQSYRRLEPWYWLMRLLGLVAVVLAIWKPT
ncbi:MAG: hypothetical protein ACFB6R_07210 [Alphaproteobacteria bacterium]